MALKLSESALSALAEDVVRQLTSTECIGNRVLITLPILYPSGTALVVEIRQHGDRYSVSDIGMGCQEAEMFGAPLTFSRHGPVIAEDAGICFDKQAFFLPEVSRERLVGATMIVANCSQEAVAYAALRLAERKTDDHTPLLLERLEQFFGRANVSSKSVEIRGDSNTPWPITALVRRDDNVALFEPVQMHHGSISHVVTKFTDIARLEHPPALISVVRQKEQYGTYLAVLSQTSHVIELDARQSAYEHSMVAA